MRQLGQVGAAGAVFDGFDVHGLDGESKSTIATIGMHLFRRIRLQCVLGRARSLLSLISVAPQGKRHIVAGLPVLPASKINVHFRHRVPHHTDSVVIASLPIAALPPIHWHCHHRLSKSRIIPLLLFLWLWLSLWPCYCCYCSQRCSCKQRCRLHC